jgi:hypothetical protein
LAAGFACLPRLAAGGDGALWQATDPQAALSSSARFTAARHSAEAASFVDLLRTWCGLDTAPGYRRRYTTFAEIVSDHRHADPHLSMLFRSDLDSAVSSASARSTHVSGTGHPRRTEASKRSPKMPDEANAETRPNRIATYIAKSGGLGYEVDGEEPRVPLPQGRAKKTQARNHRARVRFAPPDSVWGGATEALRERERQLRKLVTKFRATVAASPR